MPCDELHRKHLDEKNCVSLNIVGSDNQCQARPSSFGQKAGRQERRAHTRVAFAVGQVLQNCHDGQSSAADMKQNI